jgi:hypothetical protein
MSDKLPSKETVKRLQEQYPAGTRVEIISMDDPYTTLRSGDRGAISFFDSTGTAFVDWDNGSTLGLVYGVDRFKHADDTPVYESGADFWRDTAVRYGIEEALTIGGNYLSTQLKRELPDKEHLFCRELFLAMYEVAAERCDSARLVYPYSFEKANEREEVSYFHTSRKHNGECARAIDAAIHDSCYTVNHYNLDIAAMKAIHELGFPRVNAVLAHQFQTHSSDLRYSPSNKQWAKDFDLAAQAFDSAYMQAHPILIEDFAKHARKLYDEAAAERFALPGRPESGTFVQGYEITRAVAFDDLRGFALGHNPDAVTPYVCWQFTAENGKRDFYWGNYADDEKAAADNYIARTIVHMSDEHVNEVQSSLTGAETRAGRSGGAAGEQSLADIREHATEPLPEAKPSVLKQIRGAQKAPKPAHKQKQPRKNSEAEL